MLIVGLLQHSWSLCSKQAELDRSEALLSVFLSALRITETPVSLRWTKCNILLQDLVPDKAYGATKGHLLPAANKAVFVDGLHPHRTAERELLR